MNRSELCIVSGKRTPIGSIGKSLRQIPSPFLLAQALKGLKNLVPESWLGCGVFACALQRSLGINPSKQGLYLAGFDKLNSFTINTGHTGGIKSLILACQEILMGAQGALCGGFDSASLAPHVLMGRSGWKPHNGIIDTLSQAYTASTGIHYGLAIEELNMTYNISRVEQETYSRYAFKRRNACQKIKYFDEEIVTLDVLLDDELCIYPEFEPIGPLFYSRGTVTSLTTALPSDGATVLLVARKDAVEKLGLDYLVCVVDWVEKRGDMIKFPEILNKTVKELLVRNGLMIHNIGLWEFNDFFATIPFLCCKILGVKLENANATGGNLSLGDTLAASSARSVLNCARWMKLREIKFGVVVSTNCEGEVVVMLLKGKIGDKKEEID